MAQYAFTFGRYKGLSMAEVLEISPSYVHWCACKMAAFRTRLQNDWPEVYQRMKRAERAKDNANAAWCWFGGRMPTFDGIYRSLERRDAQKGTTTP